MGGCLCEFYNIFDKILYMRKLFFVISLLILIVLISGCIQEGRTPLEGEGEETTESASEIPESALTSLQLGYCAHHGEWRQLEEDRERFGCLNLIWERAMPEIANWQQIEPRKGEYHWEYIDRYVRTAQQRNIQILFTISPYTDWDQETCNLDLPYIPHYKPEEGEKGDWGKFGRGKDILAHAHRKGKPCDMEAYEEFLRRLVERYDGDGLDDMPGLRYQIRYWEIGNEVDCRGYFQGSAKDYFEILKVSYTIIKQTDPNAKVLISTLPSLGRDPKFEFGRPDFDPVKLFKLGAADYFDIGNVHDIGADRHEIVREFMERYGAGDKPIWITEPGGIGGYQGHAETEEELALRLFQLFEDLSKYDITMFFGWGGDSIDPALHQALLRTNYIKDGRDSDSFYDVWCGNKIVQEGEECEDICPKAGSEGVSASKSRIDCDPIEGMVAECIDCACVYHETFCGDNIPEGDEECEIAWNCEFIRGMAPTCEECACVYHEGSYCGNDIPEEGEECETSWNCVAEGFLAGMSPTCENCTCVYHEGSYCGNDMPEEGEECEQDLDCGEPPEGFEVSCEECECVYN